MILINLLSATNHPEAQMIEQRNLLLPFLTEVRFKKSVNKAVTWKSQNCDGDQACEENKNDLFLLSMIMESKTRNIRQEDILPLLLRGDDDKYEFMFFTMMMNERKMHCESRFKVSVFLYQSD